MGGGVLSNVIRLRLASRNLPIWSPETDRYGEWLLAALPLCNRSARAGIKRILKILTWSSFSPDLGVLTYQIYPPPPSTCFYSNKSGTTTSV